MMPKIRIITATVCAVSLAAFAFEPAPNPNLAPKENVKERKTCGIFFGKPAKSDPSQQFAFAAKLEDAGKLRQAKCAFDALVRRWPHSADAPAAQMKVALLLYDTQKFQKSFDEFQYLIDFYPGEFDHLSTIDHQFRIANHVMTAKVGNILFLPGFKAPERALPLFSKIIANAPSSLYALDAQFNMGLIHEEQKEYEQAIAAYDAVQNKHSNNPMASDASYRKAVCMYALAEESPRDEKTTREAMAALSSFTSMYPDHQNTVDARNKYSALYSKLAEKSFNRALFYDLKSKNSKAAVIAYREYLRSFPVGKNAYEAQERLDELTETE